MTAASLLAPVAAPSLAERFSAVLDAVRALRPGRHERVSDDVRAGYAMLAARLHAAMLTAGVAYTTPSRRPRDLAKAHKQWAEVRDATAKQLAREAEGYARARSGLADAMEAGRDAFAALARGIDELFERLTEGRL